VARILTSNENERGVAPFNVFHAKANVARVQKTVSFLGAKEKKGYRLGAGSRWASKRKSSPDLPREGAIPTGFLEMRNRVGVQAAKQQLR